MESRVGDSIGKFKIGYGCAQAIVCTYCKDFGFDETDAFKMTEAFGVGMGAGSVCGAVSGACVLVGMKYSDGNLEKPKSKATCYRVSKKIIKEFEEKNTTTICRELKGAGTGEVIRSCGGCVADAAKLVEKYLFSDDEGDFK